MKRLTFFLFLFGFQFSFAQNWQLFYEGEEFLFEEISDTFLVPNKDLLHHADQILGYRSKLIFSEDWTSYYRFQNEVVNNFDTIYNCEVLKGKAFLGDVMCTLNGTNKGHHYCHFGHNSAKASKGFFFYTDLKKDSLMRMYNLSDTTFIVCKNMGVFYEDVLSVKDSVRVFQLFVYDSLGNLLSGFPIAKNINGFEIKLSKNYGLVQTLNFRDFPHRIQKLKIMGTSKDKLGFQNFSEKNMYDYKVGDVFHKQRSAVSMPYAITELWADTVISKVFNSDSTVGFRIKRKRELSKVSASDSLFINTIDTISIVNQPLYKSKLPLEVVGDAKISFLYNGDFGYRSLPMNCDLINYTLSYLTLQRSDSLCFSFIIDHGGNQTLIPGVGKTYSWESFTSYDHSIEEYTYIKKGVKSCGKPLVLSVNDQPQNQQELSITISPNPSNSFFMLSFSERFTGEVAIYNMQGAQMFKEDITRSQHYTVYHDLPLGAYLLEVFSKSGVAYHQKLTIE